MGSNPQKVLRRPSCARRILPVAQRRISSGALVVRRSETEDLILALLGVEELAGLLGRHLAGGHHGRFPLGFLLGLFFRTARLTLILLVLIGLFGLCLRMLLLIVLLAGRRLLIPLLLFLILILRLGILLLL